MSDFSYGEFIYNSIDGDEVRYFCGLENETWNCVSKLVSKLIKKKDLPKIGHHIQKIIGYVADRNNPNSYFTQNIYCPKRKSSYVNVNTNKRIGIRNYENLTFRNFNSLLELKKRKWVESLLY